MATKTHQVRLEIKSRLASLSVENGKAAEIQAVLNPVQVRNKKNHPATGRMAILWTESSQALEAQGMAVKWQQNWAIDFPVEWSSDDDDTSEDLLDQIKVELGSVLLPKINGVKEQKLESLEVSYPANGSGSAMISVELVTVYIETLS